METQAPEPLYSTGEDTATRSLCAVTRESLLAATMETQAPEPLYSPGEDTAVRSLCAVTRESLHAATKI